MSRSPPVLTDMEISFMFLLVVTLSCPVQTSVKTCRPDQFSCGNTMCVPMKWKCDGDNDCLNGADEEGCDKRCRSTEFSCGDKYKACVPMRWRCDGNIDCLNGADEEGCGEAAVITSQNQTAQSEAVKTCRPNQFSCGDTKCVSMRWKCDGDNDCLNGADEEGCDKSCRSTEFSCGDKYKACVPMRWRCDGNIDCLNGADEEGCGEAAAITSQNQTAPSEDKSCRSTEFSCGDKHKTCVPMIWRCDGDNDCLNGADEEGCGEAAAITSQNQTAPNEVTQGEAVAITSQNQKAQSEDE
uniref:Uncharacterized protein n=1 Tax=Cyprinus carpio carpio TaxID=630221 RepID=A0A9J8CP39_CYPCA